MVGPSRRHPAQDFKRVGDADTGPNTGGMGAYTPLPWAPAGLVDEVVAQVAQPTVDEMARRGTPFVGVLYCGLPVLALTFLRRQDDGLLTFWALALVWATDIGAFFAGRSIGGPKLAPRISPAKTWSGLIGGIALATALALVLHLFEGLPLHLVLATPMLAILAQGGDLYESAIKRRAGVKDSGNILPGHGGVLDRLDGLVPVAPVAALLVLVPHLLG